MENVSIVKKADGIYLSVGDLNGQKLSRKDVLTLIDSYGLKEVDFVSLNAKLRGVESYSEIKLTSQTHMHQQPEKTSIEASKDKMEAFITFEAPVNNGDRLDERGICDALDAAGILEYNMDIVRQLTLHRAHGRKYSIAKGKTPTAGIDGYLQYHFNNENLRPKPKILEDGSVDFRQLGILRLCDRGDVLVTSVPPKDGQDGTDVMGNTIPFTQGRNPQPIPAGRNTSVSGDGMHLIADESGQLLIQQGKIHISPVLEVKGNVDNSTGNIDFNGQVVIGGNVLTGFTVRAVGNIEIYGVCEGATLVTEADIVIGRGAQGMDKARINAGGNVTAKFIESCTVTSGGNVTADSILNSNINSGGDVILSGKRGLLTGGKLIAGNKLSAKTIGSPMGTATIIEVGNKPTTVIGLKESTAEYDKLRKEFEKVDQAVSLLTAQQRKGTLTDERKQLLMKMLNAKMTYRENLNKLQLQIEEMNQMLTSNAGTVSASNVIQPGVRVTIGNSQLAVRDRMSHCTLRNNGEKITFGPYAG
jgi:uncharacterized protein (DUF342 family)